MSVGISPPGFRLPARSHVGSVRLQVADLERSIAFYRDVVGFTGIVRTNGGARLSARAGETVLLELDEKPGVRPVPRRRLLGLYHFAVLLPTRPALGAFVRHLADVPMQVGMADHSYSQSIYLHDPDGLGVEVYADQPRGTWEVRNAEYVGTVDPLDVNALLANADPAPWPGLSSGTTIGHVHLYIGDLAEAAAFYHVGLGFDRIGSFPGALFVSAGGYHHHVGLNTWAAGSPAAGEHDARLLEWRLIVPDGQTVDDLALHLAQAGIETERDGDSLQARDLWNIAVTVKSAG